MKYRILGKTGLKISAVGFGGIPIQKVSKDEAKSIILKAEELGINFIDSAKGYTVSEVYIGEALKERRGRWIIATKSMARDGKSMTRDIESSLKNLQTDYIDLYQFHNIRTMEEYNKVFGENGAYSALEKARQQGKVGHIGMSSHSIDMLGYAVDDVRIETVMYPYSIVETQAKEVFKKAAERNIGIIAMKPMAGGAIEDSALAMRFILENESVTTAIPGMASIEEVVKNVSASDSFNPLSAEERETAARIARETGSTFCRRCGYCAPCPQGIDIPSMFLFERYKRSYDLAEWAESRYFACKKTAENCIGCGECEPRCPYDLPIRKMMADVRKIFEGEG